MKIIKTCCASENEPFLHSFGFKGKTLSGVWQVYVALCSEDASGIGLGVQSVLWSDSRVFAAYGEQRSNELMCAVTRYALELVAGQRYEKPDELIRDIFPRCRQYACTVTQMQVTDTFVLNALVPVDLAAWQLWVRQNGVQSFDAIFFGQCKQEKLANIPLITYGTAPEAVRKMAEDGVCIFKIKLGADPDGDGDPAKMLAWDQNRIQQLHQILQDVHTPYTSSGRCAYYFDANGRYENRSQLERLLECMDRNGVLAQTVLFEEPFAPENEIEVGDLPVTFAADESAHSLADVERRMDLGFRAITLKPIAKTLSATVEMAKYVQAHQGQCFCADLTVNPVMVEWNKNVAARLQPLEGMRIGVVESNGAQNYRNWNAMKARLPVPIGGGEQIYTLDSTYYRHNGGIFEIPEYYRSCLESKCGVTLA